MGHLEKKITYSNNMPFKMGTLDLLSKYGVDDFVECDKPRSGESGVLIVYSRLLLMQGGLYLLLHLLPIYLVKILKISQFFRILFF